MLANVVLHRVDRVWTERYHRLGVLVRYADDECICCPTRERAEAALAALGEILAGLGLSLAADKTRIVSVASGDVGYDFLGFHHRMVPSRRNPRFRYPACWPSATAMHRARSHIRERTGRNRRHVLTHLLVEELNRFLRGWRQYFRYGNSSRSFAKLDRYVTERMALLLSKRPPRPGQRHEAHHHVREPPRPRQPGRERRVRPARACRPVKGVGKPCEGEPHARIDGGRLETGRRPLVRGEMCSGETPGIGAGTYRRPTSPRQPPTLLRHAVCKHTLGSLENFV